MSFQQPKSILSARQAKVFVEYFPGEPITNRLINWLHLQLVWANGRLDVCTSLDVLVWPNILIDELKKMWITPDKVKEVRLAKMYEKHHFFWFEESDIFYHTFMYSIHEQKLDFTSPILLKPGRVDQCIMLFDGIIGDRCTTDIFLLNAKQRWADFKPVIEVLKWVRKGDFEKNRDAVISSFDSVGVFIPITKNIYFTDDPYIEFMVYIFSLGISKHAAKSISTQAKKIIRQSLPRRTKGKSQVNVLIDNFTINKLENICKSKNSSKANLITELINNYSAYGKEIDSAIQEAKIKSLIVDYDEILAKGARIFGRKKTT